ncbi:MAG: DUF2867 domain-containing protein [Bacteroidota bacterium]
MTVFRIPTPTHTLVYPSLQPIHYDDTFAVRLPAGTDVQLRKLPVLFFYSFPRWLGVLFGIREVIARLAGLKTAQGIDVAQQLQEFKGEVGESVALFHVMEVNEEEIVTGESDSHLDFRLAFRKIPVAHQTEIQLITTVHFHNRMGRLYFWVVKPFHKLIVKSVMRRMARRLTQA